MGLVLEKDLVGGLEVVLSEEEEVLVAEVVVGVDWMVDLVKELVRKEGGGEVSVVVEKDWVEDLVKELEVDLVKELVTE